MIHSKLSGDEIKRLMRRHKVTIRELASEMQVTMKRIREVRENGVTGPTVRDWLEHITGHDPGRKRQKLYSSARRSAAAAR